MKVAKPVSLIGYFQAMWPCSTNPIATLGDDRPDLQSRIANEGSGQQFLECRPECKSSGVCINGMSLNSASNFGVPETQLSFCVDYLLTDDG